jgi:hypothetical protein
VRLRLMNWRFHRRLGGSFKLSLAVGSTRVRAEMLGCDDKYHATWQVRPLSKNWWHLPILVIFFMAILGPGDSISWTAVEAGGERFAAPHAAYLIPYEYTTCPLIDSDWGGGYPLIGVRLRRSPNVRGIQMTANELLRRSDCNIPYCPVVTLLALPQ